MRERSRGVKLEKDSGTKRAKRRACPVEDGWVIIFASRCPQAYFGGSQGETGGR